MLHVIAKFVAQLIGDPELNILTTRMISIISISIMIGRREIPLMDHELLVPRSEFRLVEAGGLATKFTMIGATVWDDRRVK